MGKKEIKKTATRVWHSRFKYAAIAALVALLLVLVFFGVTEPIDANLNQ